MVRKIQRMEKLVRDNIPLFIAHGGGKIEPRFLKGKELLNALHRKLDEELRELQESRNIEEAADLYEVAAACVLAMGGPHGELVPTGGIGGCAAHLSLDKLLDMIQQDVSTFHREQRIESLVSMMILLYRCVAAMGGEPGDLDRAREMKKRVKGAFTTGCYIGSVVYEDSQN